MILLMILLGQMKIMVFAIVVANATVTTMLIVMTMANVVTSITTMIGLMQLIVIMARM